jgi:hypothetical protein
MPESGEAPKSRLLEAGTCRRRAVPDRRGAKFELAGTDFSRAGDFEPGGVAGMTNKSLNGVLKEDPPGGLPHGSTDFAQ